MDTHLHGNFRMPRKTKMDDGGGWRHGRAFDSWLPASPCLTETPFALSPGLLPSELHILDCPSNYAMRFASPRARHLESVRLAFHQETGGGGLGQGSWEEPSWQIPGAFLGRPCGSWESGNWFFYHFLCLCTPWVVFLYLFSQWFG